ncbi:hypothetical protein [Muricoccus radiodurans]|uniref:hypothetical protein n=1 Tax=Muricoccus radiodurans TaxID=2231721 RepID=UPI003CE7EAB6
MKLPATLMAMSALALLSACASEPPPPPPPPPMAAAAPPPPPMAAPAPTMAPGRYVGVARLAQPSRACRIRSMNVSATVAGDQVTLNGRRPMQLTNARFEDGMIMGETSMRNCQYNVSLRPAAARRAHRRAR